MLPRTSIQCVSRKPIVDHCCSFSVAMIILWVLVKYKDAYPLNYILLFFWMLALITSVPPACLILLSNQGGQEYLDEEIFPVSMNCQNRAMLIEIVTLCWPNYSLVRDKLMSYKTVMSRVAILTLSLSIFLVFFELLTNLSTSTLSSTLAMFRTAMSFWWTYSLLSGLKFGGYVITESQHRSVAHLNRMDPKEILSTSTFSFLCFFHDKLTSYPV
jgi:hypothetical protein